MRRILTAALFMLSTNALAIEKNNEGWYHTGDAMRTKSVAFVSVKVYAIGHDMKCVPAKSKQAAIDADCDKRFAWKMMRDVDKAKILTALREAYANNGYNDQNKINAALNAFTIDLKENAWVTITYDAAKKTTTFWEQNGGSVTVSGEDFMKATWSIWFGKIDPPALGDQLIKNL